MSLSQLIRPDAVLAALRVNGKKQALQEMSERAALVSGLPAREIFDAILQRERLGSTGVGDGVAIPHGKLAKCQQIFGVFARLERALDRLALRIQHTGLQCHDHTRFHGARLPADQAAFEVGAMVSSA